MKFDAVLLKNRMTELGISQRSLARKLNVTTRTIRRWIEKEETEKFEELCNAVSAQPGQLLK